MKFIKIFENFRKPYYHRRLNQFSFLDMTVGNGNTEKMVNWFERNKPINFDLMNSDQKEIFLYDEFCEEFKDILKSMSESTKRTIFVNITSGI